MSLLVEAESALGVSDADRHFQSNDARKRKREAKRTQGADAEPAKASKRRLGGHRAVRVGEAANPGPRARPGVGKTAPVPFGLATVVVQNRCGPS